MHCDNSSAITSLFGP
uniref:Uncharacterized protein n=1 Tax=Arundo donax TaxID=35708 RepID=A0A0A8YY51_ARUDO